LKIDNRKVSWRGGLLIALQPGRKRMTVDPWCERLKLRDLRHAHFLRNTLDWSDLKYYGSSENVFMIQFASVGTFQIFSQAFRRSEWRTLKNFLVTTFPDRKASGYFGDRMFRWPRRKT
jgi:hypothetical protein